MPHTRDTSVGTVAGMVFPEQRLVVAHAEQDLEAVLRVARDEGWILRRVPLELASCDAQHLARHRFVVIRRTLAVTCPG